MNQWQLMFRAVLEVFGIAGLGALLRRIDWLTEEADRSLLRLIIRVLYPALILDVMLENKGMLGTGNLLWPPLVGAATLMIGFILTWAFARWMGKRAGLNTSAELRTFVLAVGLFNYGFVPVPLCETLFGSGTVAVMFLHNAGVEIVLWTVGILIISGHMGSGWWRRVLNGPTLAILAALVLLFAGMDGYIPPPVRFGIHTLRGAAIPLSVLLIGAIAADEFRGSTIVRGKRVVLWACILRLGILPAIFLAIGVMIPASIELKRVIAIQAAMPAATFPIVLARQYNADPTTALRVCIGTSLVSLATMTGWLSAGMALLHAG